MKKKITIHCKYNASMLWKKISALSILLIFLLSSIAIFSVQATDIEPVLPLPQRIELLNDNRSIMVNNVSAEIKNNLLKFLIDENNAVRLINIETNDSHILKVHPDKIYELIAPQLIIQSIQLNMTDTRSYYEVRGKKDLLVSDGYVRVELVQHVDAETGKSTFAQKRIMKNNELIDENKDELLVVDKNTLKRIHINEPDIKREKLLVSYIEPLVTIEKIENPNIRGRFIAQVKKNSDLSSSRLLLSSENYDFIVIEDNLINLIKNELVLKICDQENAQKLVYYAKEILRIEAENEIRKLRLKKTVFDILDSPELLEIYAEENGWDVKPGQTAWYQQFVTPDDPAVQDLIINNNIRTPQEAYNVAVQWIWVSDSVLHDRTEKWLLPHDFLMETPYYPSNPLPGYIVSDCEEQANTLVSVLRAIDVPAENVRVALGRVKFDDVVGGHAWVEIKEDGRWMVLDPTSGPYYDEESETLIQREGLRYDYWMYYPYPVEEVWCYYNEVYFTDEITEIAQGWANTYNAEEHTRNSILAGFVSDEARLESVVLHYYMITLLVIILVAAILIVVQLIRKK